MRSRGRRLSAFVAVATLAVAGCGGSTDDSAQGPDNPRASAGAGASPDDTASPSTPDDDASSRDDDGGSAAESEDNAVEIEVEIENGQVTPSGERVDVAVGQPIRFVVDSDTADEIHVHSTPEHSFRIRAGADDKQFQFRLTQPGVVEAELHEQGDVLVTIAARP
jgi:plastocyanin